MSKSRNHFVMFFFLVSSFCSLNACDEHFFQKPILFSEEEYTQEIEDKTLDMCWNFGSDSRLRFVTSNSETYFEVVLGALSDFSEDVLADVKPPFYKTESGLRIFSYRVSEDGHEELFTSIVKKDPGHPDNSTYIVGDRRVFENASPMSITLPVLEEMIKSHSVLIYTGAGISIASGIPGMDQLEELTGMGGDEESLMNSLKHTIENPREFATKAKMFHDACLHCPPSPAHYALRGFGSV